MSGELVVVPRAELSVEQEEQGGVPTIAAAAGTAAMFAWDECFGSSIRNDHTEPPT
jgi:hypothetical protein